MSHTRTVINCYESGRACRSRKKKKKKKIEKLISSFYELCWRRVGPGGLRLPCLSASCLPISCTRMRVKGYERNEPAPSSLELAPSQILLTERKSRQQKENGLTQHSLRQFLLFAFISAFETRSVRIVFLCENKRWPEKLQTSKR